MSLTKGLTREMKRVIMGITGPQTDFEDLSERVEVVGPELNYLLVEMAKKGFVEYNENGSTTGLTEKGRIAVLELQKDQLSTP